MRPSSAEFTRSVSAGTIVKPDNVVDALTTIEAERPRVEDIARNAAAVACSKMLILRAENLKRVTPRC